LDTGSFMVVQSIAVESAVSTFASIETSPISDIEASMSLYCASSSMIALVGVPESTVRPCCSNPVTSTRTSCRLDLVGQISLPFASESDAG